MPERATGKGKERRKEAASLPMLTVFLGPARLPGRSPSQASPSPEHKIFVRNTECYDLTLPPFSG